MAIFGHIVIKDGVWYEAGQDVPASTPEPKPIDDKKTIELDETKTEKPTKTEINRMSTAELQKTADNIGFDDAFSKSGSELKKILIDYYEL